MKRFEKGGWIGGDPAKDWKGIPMEDRADGLRIVYRPAHLPYVVKVKEHRLYSGGDGGWSWVNKQAFEYLDEAQDAADKLASLYPNAEIVVVQR